MSSVLSGQMDADGVCLTSAWLPFWILGGPVKALPLLRCEAALTGADQYPTPAAHAILSVIIPHIKQDSSRAIAVFITLCCFPLYRS